MAVPPGLSEAVIASLIIAMGLVALAFGASRWRSGDRTAFWFGLFGCLYGVRLSGQSPAVQPLLPEVVRRYLDASINYAIVVPAGLFIESVLGPGWRLTLRRTWQGAAVFAMLAILHDVLRRQPGATQWLTRPVVLTAGIIAAAHVLGYWRRGSWPRGFRIVATGGLIFLGVAACATISGGARELESVAMLVFMTSVGYFVAQRMLASERRLVAVSSELELVLAASPSVTPNRFVGEIVAGLRRWVGSDTQPAGSQLHEPADRVPSTLGQPTNAEDSAEEPAARCRGMRPDHYGCVTTDPTTGPPGRGRRFESCRARQTGRVTGRVRGGASLAGLLT